METNPTSTPTTKEDHTLRHLTVATFNVLADCYTDAFRKRTQSQRQSQSLSQHQGPRGYVAEKHLRWAHRRPLLCKWLKQFSQGRQVDVLCLQEVDHYASFYAPLLTDIGFDHVYYQRPSRKDGLVVAWRRDRLELRNKVEVDYDQIVGLPPNAYKHNVGLVCFLREIAESGPRDFIIANTHLHWNPARRLLKLMQVSRLLKVIEGVIQSGGNHMGCLVCGDLNSLPGSPVIELIRKGVHVEEPMKGFFCDASLGKVVKYLRALGVDCLHEQGLTADPSLVFQHCHASSRVLITRSKVVVYTEESSLLQVVEECNLVVDEDLFYTRCVKCNGNIETVERCDIHPSRVGREGSERAKDSKNYIPTELFNQEDVPLAQCDSCEQIYWWSTEEDTVRVTKAKNSSVRAKETVTKLTDLVAQRQSSRVNRHLEMRVHGRTFISPMPMESAMLAVNGEEVNTNNTEQFQGCIDYIFYHKLAADNKANRLDPVTAYTLPPKEDETILPSSQWPSDHRCIVARFVLDA